LKPPEGVDAIKELRHVLKLALRRHGLRCISVERGSGNAIRATSI
jgi:hypothetical protein